MRFSCLFFIAFLNCLVCCKSEAKAKISRHFFPPLTLTIGLTDTVTLYNTGKTVEAIINQCETAYKARGSNLKGAYIYSRTVFLWSDGNSTVTGSSIKGAGTKFLISIYFYKKQYQSFENALLPKDGLFEIRIPIVVGASPNVIFYPFQYYLRKVTKAGSSVDLSIVIKLIWFNFFPPTEQYYIYQSSFKNQTTGQVYDCVTTNHKFVNGALRFISKQQFDDIFPLLETLIGDTGYLLPRGKVYLSFGLIEIPTVIRMNPVNPGGL